MATLYWYGGSGTWDVFSADQWSSTSGTNFTGTMTGTTTLTVSGVTGTALAIGKTVRRLSDGALVGVIVSGSGSTWTLDTAGTYAGVAMGAGSQVLDPPSDVDDVIFDANSSSINFIVKPSSGYCRDFTVTIATAGRLTFEGPIATGDIYCHRSAAINAATTLSLTNPINLSMLAQSGACTVSTNNLRFASVGFGDNSFVSTATWTVSNGITCQYLTIKGGTVNTNGQTITITTQHTGAVQGDNCYFEAQLGATVTLGTSAINIGTSANEIIGGLASMYLTSITLNANTSVITIGSTNTTNWNNSALYSDGYTFATLVLNGNYSDLQGTNTFTTRLTKNAVFNESILKVYANQTLNSGHTLQLIGTASARLLVLSDICRTQRTFTLLGTTGTRTLSFVSFMDIVMSFGSSLTGTSVGDMLNNSGITFTAPVTRYAVLGSSPSTKNFSSTSAWSTSSGGATGASIPLPQDTVIFDANSGTGDIVFDTLYAGSNLTATGFLGTTTIAPLGYEPLYVLGQVTNTPNGFFPISVVFRFNSNINLPSGLVWGVIIDGDSATATMSASLDLGLFSRGVNVISGNFNTNSYNLTAFHLRSSAPSNAGVYQNRSLFTNTTYTLGSSLLRLGATTLPVTFQVADTVNANTSTIELTSLSTSTIQPNFGNQTLYNLKLSPGSTAATYSGLSGATFNNITLSAHTSLVKISLDAGQTLTTGSMNINGTKGAGVIIAANLTVGGPFTTNATLAIGSNVVTEYVAFLGITKSGASTLDARGAADLGSNSGISFQQHSVIAFSGSGTTSFTVPANFTGSSYMLVLGAGGGAAKRSAPNVSAAGGGSGAIAVATNLNVSAGQTIYVNSPVGGAGATVTGNGGSPVNAWINRLSNFQPSSSANGAYADSGGGSSSSTTTGGVGGTTTGSLGQLTYPGVSGGTAAASSSSSTYGSGGAGGSSGNLIFRTAKAGGVSTSSNGGGGGGSIQNAGSGGVSTGVNGGAGGAVGANPGGTAGVGGASPTAGGNGTAGTGVGGGGGGGSNTAGVNSGAGGNGATGSQWTYNSLNGVASSGSIGYGGGAGGGGGISNIALANSFGGAGGNGGIGAGGGGGGRGSTSGGATGNGGNGGDSLVLFVYVEARGGNFATIIG